MKTQFFAHIFSIGVAFSGVGRQVGAEVFLGPGGLSCVQGVCMESSDCNDFDTYIQLLQRLQHQRLCKSSWRYRYYQFYGGIRKVDSCRLAVASNLSTEDPIEIYAGCCISCTGCTFIDYLTTFSGPGWLECRAGNSVNRLLMGASVSSRIASAPDFILLSGG